MGGYGSGGHNKTHKQLENFRRIDSFSFYDYLKGDKYLFCKETVKYPLFRGDIVYYVGEGMAEIREGDSYTDLMLSSVPGIDGKSTRLYFHCPYCGKRVRYLYRRQEHYMCRNCAKLNYSSQQKSGMDEMRLKMERIVEKKRIYMVVERLSRYAYSGLVAYPKAALYAVGEVRKIVKGVPAAPKGL